MSGSSPTTQPSASVKFDRQTYLLSYFDDISNVANSIHYSYVYCLNTNNDVSFPAAMATFTDRANLNKFTELKTYQYDSLIPNISLYRMEYDSQKNIKSEKEFIFDKDTKYTISDMTSPIVRNNCGIKSINWNLAGTNPVTAEKQIEVQIQFYFDSINSFSGGNYDDMVSAWKNSTDLSSDKFKFCDVDDGSRGGTTKNYWSLIFHPQQKSDKNKYDTFNYRIKAMVGWHSIEPNFRDSLKLAGAEEDLEKLTYSFFLNLVKHEFTLNEDGSINLTANYIGSFENTAFNYNFNILGDLKEQIENLKNKSLRDIAGTIATAGPDDTGSFTEVDILKQIDDISTGGATLDPETRAKFEQLLSDATYNELAGQQKLLRAITNEETKKSLASCVDTPQALRNLLNDPNSNVDTISKSVEKESELLQKIVDYSNVALSQASFFVKNQFYSRFIDKLLENDPSAMPKYFSKIVTKDEKKNWQDWYYSLNNQVSKPKFNNSNLSDSALSAEIDNVQNSVKQSLDQVMRDNDILSLTTKNETITDDQAEIKIIFTTYGYVIDTAFKVVEAQIMNSGAGTATYTLLNELKRQKVILCNISDEDQIFNYNNSGASSTTPKFRNLAFVPIEITLLKNFLIENVVKPQKDVYPLYSFIKDTLSQIVIPAMNSFDSSNNEVDKYSNFSLASTIFTLGDNSEDRDPLKLLAELQVGSVTTNSSFIDAKDLFSTKDALKTYYINYRNIKNHKNYYSYYVMFDKNLSDYKPTNDRQKDAEKGIYWYTYGQDYGLIKSINFSRIDTPYLKEAKSVGKKTFFLGQFRDRYNAQLTMIGNNIYYPGMLVHITPSIEASSTPSADNPNFAQITGIGGYYLVHKVESSISEDGYETKLTTTWNSDGYEPSNSISEDQKCKALLEQAGITSENKDKTTQLMSILNNISIQISQQELEDEQANQRAIDAFGQAAGSDVGI